ncbi:MAG: endonuclease III [Deltaproteobacteria bacterium]|nr:endonuclease III [Deltaproteobacteria bacterium]
MARGKRAEAERLQQILDLLKAGQPPVVPGLRHGDPWQLVVATVLSAQCTDARVNLVTPGLFDRYPTPADLARAPVPEVEEEIRSIGLFRAKAKNLVALAKRVVEDHGGRVPGRREALEALPGVGRKTASVVLAQGFAAPAFAVDTHVGRVGWRLGFAPTREPRAVERGITDLLDPSRWAEAHLLLIRHGRQICRARRPRCPDCPVRGLCPWPDKTVPTPEPRGSRRRRADGGRPP